LKGKKIAKEFEIKGDWINSESGQKYVANAVTKKGRILAIVTVHIPIDVGVDFTFYYGSEHLKTEIEKACQEQVKLIAEATPEKEQG